MWLLIYKLEIELKFKDFQYKKEFLIKVKKNLLKFFGDLSNCASYEVNTAPCNEKIIFEEGEKNRSWQFPKNKDYNWRI